MHPTKVGIQLPRAIGLAAEVRIVVGFLVILPALCALPGLFDDPGHWSYIGPSYSAADCRRMAEERVRLEASLRAPERLADADPARSIARMNGLAAEMESGAYAAACGNGPPVPDHVL